MQPPSPRDNIGEFITIGHQCDDKGSMLVYHTRSLCLQPAFVVHCKLMSFVCHAYFEWRAAAVDAVANGSTWRTSARYVVSIRLSQTSSPTLAMASLGILVSE